MAVRKEKDNEKKSPEWNKTQKAVRFDFGKIWQIYANEPCVHRLRERRVR